MSLTGPTAPDLQIVFDDGPFTVSRAPTITTVSVGPSTPGFGAPVTFTATVTPMPANGFTPTGTVGFLLDNQPTPVAISALTGGQASFTTSGIGAGRHSVTAVYNGDRNFIPSNSAAAPFTVITMTAVTGKHPGALIVGSGTTVLLHDATVGGAVVVQAGGSLDIERATIGPLTASSPGALRVCASTVQGALTATGANGFVLIGDPGDDGCLPNTIGGALTVQHNHHGLEVIGNRIGGAVVNTGNSGAGAFPEDSSPDIAGNT